MSGHPRDHAHGSDQSAPKRGHPNQSGRVPTHTPPDQVGFAQTNGALFNPNILEASIKEIASRLEDGEKADLLLYAVRKLDISRERRVSSPCPLVAGHPFRAYAIIPPCHLLRDWISRAYFRSPLGRSRARTRFHFQCRSASTLAND